MLQERLKQKKQELGLTTEQLSQLSGVPIGTINKILNGETKSPRYDTLEALEEVLYGKKDSAQDQIHEAVAYRVKQPGEYTIDDYQMLPQDVRAELIDGKFIYMEAPSIEHQDISMAITVDIEMYIREKKGTCKVFAAPIDVQLDCDDKTMVQPDIVVICEKEKRNKRRIYGAPDLAIEIVSESSRRTDYGLKVKKYMESGVREYWIVDAKRECIVCYYFEGEDYPIFYTFENKVPVRIYNKDLNIDFLKIKERLAEL